MLYLGADHRGFKLKEKIKEWLKDWGLEHQDLGNDHWDSKDDYVDFAREVAQRVAEGQGQGILVCGSGQGMSIVANKFPGVRSVLVWSESLARLGREHEDANVLALPAEHLSQEQVKTIIKAWLETKFLNVERYRRRLARIKKLEEEVFK